MSCAPPLTFINSALPNFLFRLGSSLSCVRRLSLFAFFVGMVASFCALHPSAKVQVKDWIAIAETLYLPEK